MSFRVRLLIAVALATIVPLVLLMYGVRREMTNRLSRQADSQVAAGVAAIRSQLERQGRTTRERLRGMAAELGGDNRFRLAILGDDAAVQTWLRDWGQQAMRASGFAVLQLQDSSGRVLSSGHFRNQFDQMVPVAGVMSGSDQLLVVRAPTPDSALIALAGVDSFRVSGRLFLLTGGRGLDSMTLAGLSPSSGITAGLVLPGSPRPGSDGVAGSVGFLFVDLANHRVSVDSAEVILVRDPGPLTALRKSIDRWFLIALIITVVTALLLAAWLAARMSRPLALLAEKTAQVDLDRLDQEFATDREDEVGALARLLDAMTKRLRSSAMRLREVERRAAVGDLARQINHDVKNGLAPIRHVLRHLRQVAEREPETMAAVFKERAATLDSSIEYLDTLARNYARLSPALDRSRTDVNALLREIAQSLPDGAIQVETRLAPTLPPVQADAIVLRRILENLVTNGMDAMEGRTGQMTLLSETVEGAVPRIRVSIGDTGRGMSRQELDRAFDDFYTTKEGGTGLGLSVVRRLVSDLGGTLRVETAPGQGSRFIVELPAAGAEAPA